MHHISAQNSLRSLIGRIGGVDGRRTLVMLCLLSMVYLRPSSGQEFRAVLTGQVTDASGSVIRGAAVTAVETSTGTRYQNKTSDKGTYYIPYVLPGTYNVTAEAPGFKTSIQDNVLLKASETFAQNFKHSIADWDTSKQAPLRMMIPSQPRCQCTSSQCQSNLHPRRLGRNSPGEGYRQHTKDRHR